MSAILDRRAFLAAAAALGFVARAGADGPRALYAGARMDAQGAASLALFDEEGRESAAAPLPARAHDCALSPEGAARVVVARRPVSYARALDASTLAPRAASAPPAGSHFYGHGAFCADGARFFATENAFASGDGAIGVYDARRGFARIGEWPSGGVGPHDLALTPDGRFLVVANGGIRTHPDTGRDILNRETMRPNLTLLSVETGEVAAQAELGAEARLSSIRHLALAPDGSAVFACQHEGSPEDATSARRGAISARTPCPTCAAWRPPGATALSSSPPARRAGGASRPARAASPRRWPACPTTSGTIICCATAPDADGHRS